MVQLGSDCVARYGVHGEFPLDVCLNRSGHLSVRHLLGQILQDINAILPALECGCLEDLCGDASDIAALHCYIARPTKGGAILDHLVEVACFLAAAGEVDTKRFATKPIEARQPPGTRGGHRRGSRRCCRRGRGRRCRRCRGGLSGDRAGDGCACCCRCRAAGRT